MQAVLWDAEGHRTPDTVAISAKRIAARARFEIPADRKFIIIKEDHIGKEFLFSSEKLCVVLTIFKYSGFENALEMVRQIFEVGGRGHSCGISIPSMTSASINLRSWHRSAGLWFVSHNRKRMPGHLTMGCR